MLSVEQAWEQIAQTVVPGPVCELPLAEALGSVLAEEIVSPCDSPPFDKSMMDGYAVRHADLAEDANGKGCVLRCAGEVLAGTVPRQPVVAGTTLRIMTGAPLPEGADTVIPVEWTSRDESGEVVHLRLPEKIPRGKFVIPRGQSMRAGDLVLNAGTTLAAPALALLGEMGISRPRVRRGPTVAILATGDELVGIDTEPGPGQIRNSNALMLAAQVTQAGGLPRVFDPVRDTLADLNRQITAGLAFDFLILSGGVSMGEADLVPAALKQVQVQEVFHRVNVKPGKPVWFGLRRDPHQRNGAGERPTCVFGLPGNPVSSLVCFELFVRPAFRLFQNANLKGASLGRAWLATDFEYRSDRPTWYPARMETAGAMLRVRPVSWKGSSDLRSVAEANCSLSLPAGEIRWSSGREVAILLWGSGLLPVS